MRLLIFLLALISAFFVPYTLATPTTEKSAAQKDEDPKYTCNANNTSFLVSVDNFAACEAAARAAVANFEPPVATGGYAPFQPNGDVECTTTKHALRDEYTIGCQQEYLSTSEIPWNSDETRYLSTIGKLVDPTTDAVSYCPNPLYPDGPYTEGENDWCYMRNDGCPDPSADDSFNFSSSGDTVCFDNPNGTQCQITPDSGGGYNLSSLYASAEPAQCETPDPTDPDDPDDPTDPDDPDDPDDPTDPDDPDDPTDPDDPDASDPVKTPDPDAPDAGKDADSTDQTEVLDAVNQVNDNLDVINQNINSSSESHTERLDRIAKEIQNSNELLSSVKSNTKSTVEGLGEVFDEVKQGNEDKVELLDAIEENTKKDEFTFSAGRKQGGLNSIFTDADILSVQSEIEGKKTELTDFIETIRSESSNIFEINPQISGGYEERIKTIKGVEVDLGIGRFSGFFQLIAPAILLIATMSALYILLGSNKE